MNKLKPLFLTALLALGPTSPTIVAAEPAAANELNQANETVEETSPAMQLGYADHNGRLVIYTIDMDEEQNWSLSSEYSMTSFGFLEGHGTFDMAHGSLGRIGEAIETSDLIDNFSAQCRATFEHVMTQASEGATFFVGHDEKRGDRARVIIRNADTDWEMMSILYEPTNANKYKRCVDDEVSMRLPQPAEMIPGTDIPMPKGGKLANFERDKQKMPAVRFG